jgi:hypothetical protein
MAASDNRDLAPSTIVVMSSGRCAAACVSCPRQNLACVSLAEEAKAKAKMHRTMSQMQQRFVQRLYLPAPFWCTINSVLENHHGGGGGGGAGTAGVRHHQTTPVLELYHSSRTDKFNNRRDSLKLDETVASIFKDGFRVGYGGNKGAGVYFSNHSRYPWRWGGHRVFICHIDSASVRAGPNLEILTRYHSEIKSGCPLNSSEYVLQDPSLVRVRAVLDFTVHHPDEKDCRWTDAFRNTSVWLKRGDVNCAKCDSRPRHWGQGCDCALFPIVDPHDLVS